MVLRFSGLTAGDHIKILATHLIQRNPRWDCERCISKTTQDVRDSYGCRKPGPSRYPVGGRYSLPLCVGNYYDDRAASLFEMYNLFKMGHLPYAGTVMEQPAYIMEAFGVISDLENTEAQKQAAENKRNKRG